MTAVAEQPVVQQQPLRLRVSRKEAAAQMQNQIKIGRAIKGQRIRDRWELDQARAEKQEWVRRATETLDLLFNQPAVGEKFNAWVAPILPEYAEFDMFVALFADEMGQRLEKLQNLLKNLDAVPEPPDSITPAAAASTMTSVSTVNSSLESHMKSDAAPTTTAPTPLPTTIDQALAAYSSATEIRGALIVRAPHPTVTDAVTRFLGQLGIEMTTVDCSTAPHPPVIDALSRHDGDGASFAVVVASAEPSSSDAAAGGDYLFDLGCCVGRLGTRGVCVVHPSGAHVVDAHGVQHIAVDGSDGWHLQLARHLRRGGVNVDLNKLL